MVCDLGSGCRFVWSVSIGSPCLPCQALIEPRSGRTFGKRADIRQASGHLASERTFGKRADTWRGVRRHANGHLANERTFGKRADICDFPNSWPFLTHLLNMFSSPRSPAPLSSFPPLPRLLLFLDLHPSSLLFSVPISILVLTSHPSSSPHPLHLLNHLHPHLHLHLDRSPHPLHVLDLHPLSAPHPHPRPRSSSRPRTSPPPTTHVPRHARRAARRARGVLRRARGVLARGSARGSAAAALARRVGSPVATAPAANRDTMRYRCCRR